MPLDPPDDLAEWLKDAADEQETSSERRERIEGEERRRADDWRDEWMMEEQRKR